MAFMGFVLIFILTSVVYTEITARSNNRKARERIKENSQKELKKNPQELSLKFYTACVQKGLSETFPLTCDDKTPFHNILSEQGLIFDDDVLNSLFVMGRGRYIYNKFKREHLVDLSCGTLDLSSKRNEAKIQLLAKSLNISPDYQEINNIFLEPYAWDKLQEKRYNNSLIEKEKELMEEYLTYIKYIGREKPIQYYLSILKRYQESLYEAQNLHEKLNNNADGFINYGTQQTKDWATAGGIATGIAGGAAGLATAIDVQRQNAKIEAYNQNVIDSNWQLWFAGMEATKQNISKYSATINRVEALIEKLNTSLIAELPEKDLLNKLNITIQSNKLKETGSIFMDISVSASELIIYDDVPAVIDGSFKAVLTDKNNKKIGEIFFVLPVEGSGKSCNISGICQNVNIDASEINVLFEPNHLWAIEKVKHVKPK